MTKKITYNNGGYPTTITDFVSQDGTSLRTILAGLANQSILKGKKIGVCGDSMSTQKFFDVTWAAETRDTADYSTYGRAQHWSQMVCDAVGATLNNKGVSGCFVFSSTGNLLTQLPQLDSDIDYLIIHVGTNGARLMDKNNVQVTTLGNADSPILPQAPTLCDSTTDTMSVCGALKWLIEHIYSMFPNVKLGFITPYRESGSRRADGNFNLGTTRQFTQALRLICPLYGVPYFDSETMSGINWQSSEQCHALMGIEEIVPSISQIANFKIGVNMTFYVADENAIYKVLTCDSNHKPLTWSKQSDGYGSAYGDRLHISNTNGMRYLSYKYQRWIETL